MLAVGEYAGGQGHPLPNPSYHAPRAFPTMVWDGVEYGVQKKKILGAVH